jgi:hypothetical protein
MRVCLVRSVTDGEKPGSSPLHGDIGRRGGTDSAMSWLALSCVEERGGFGTPTKGLVSLDSSDGRPEKDKKGLPVVHRGIAWERHQVPLNATQWPVSVCVPMWSTLFTGTVWGAVTAPGIQAFGIWEGRNGAPLLLLCIADGRSRLPDNSEGVGEESDVSVL